MRLCKKEGIIMAKEKQKKITSIGGSALIEGIMMRGPKKTVMAVRTGPDKIETEEIHVKTLREKYKFFRIPFIRGIAGMIDSLKLSYKSLMLSANKAIDSIEVEEEKMSKFEKWLNDKLGEKFMNVLMTIASVFGVALAIVLFVWVPSLLYGLLEPLHPVFDSQLLRSSFEGILRIVLFLGYIIIVSQMEDMKRVFMYHGAEHKTIFCYEADEELTVENVRKHKRLHPRCGTSFMIIMLLLGIVIGLFVPSFNEILGVMWGTILRSGIKILLLPVSVGLGFELIQLCGKHDNWFTRIIAAPGMWAQLITTREPDDSMIEIAIAAITPVIPDDGSDIVNNCCK